MAQIERAGAELHRTGQCASWFDGADELVCKVWLVCLAWSPLFTQSHCALCIAWLPPASTAHCWPYWQVQLSTTTWVVWTSSGTGALCMGSWRALAMVRGVLWDFCCWHVPPAALAHVAFCGQAFPLLALLEQVGVISSTDVLNGTRR